MEDGDGRLQAIVTIISPMMTPFLRFTPNLYLEQIIDKIICMQHQNGIKLPLHLGQAADMNIQPQIAIMESHTRHNIRARA